MICKNCGKEFVGEDTVCPSCKDQSSFQNYKDESIIRHDSNNIGWFFLGFLLPFIGFIVYIIIRKTKQEASLRLFLGLVLGIVVRTIAYYLFIFLI